MPFGIALCFVLAYPNLRAEVFCLTSNSAKNGLSKFLALGFFIVTDMPTSSGMFSVTP